MADKGVPESPSRPPVRLEGLLLQEFGLPTKDGEIRPSWRLAAEHFDQSQPEVCDPARKVEAEVFAHGHRTVWLQAAGAGVSEGAPNSLELAGPVTLREDASGACLQCDRVAWDPALNRFAVEGDVTGSMDKFQLAAPGLEFVREGGAAGPGRWGEGAWRGRVAVQGPARAKIGLALLGNLGSRRGASEQSSAGQPRGSSPARERAIPQWERHRNPQTRQEKGRQRLREEGRGNKDKAAVSAGGSLWVNILLYQALAAPWRLLRGVLRLPSGQMGPPSRKDKSGRTVRPACPPGQHPLWVTRQPVTVPLGPGKEAASPSPSQRQGQRASAAVSHGARPAPRAPDEDAEVEVNAAHGILWRSAQGEVTFCGPLTLQCPYLGAQVEAGGGSFDAKRGHLRLSEGVQGTAQGMQFTAPKLLWKDRRLGRQAGRGGRLREGSQGPPPVLVAEKGLSVWKVK